MRVLPLISALLLALGGAVSSAAWAQAMVRIDGSSTVYPITEAVAEDFQKANRAIRVTVGISGTGGGFKKFCRGEIDIADASRPILKQEMAACKAAGIQFIELPVAYDALTVVINPANHWAKTMTLAQLKAVWEPAARDRVRTWKDVNPAWPATPLKLYGPGSDSGTFDYFTDAIVGKTKSSRGDYTASEDDNVLVQGVARDKGALGYFGFAYYLENQQRLTAVAVDSGKGGVLPTPETVEKGSYAPLSRPVFIYVNAQSAERAEVQAFVEYYLKQAPVLVREVRYIPLPKKAYDTALQHLKRKRLGTVFGGSESVGLSIEQLLKRDARL
jgi:phosphate transport system substrate-binding protein